MFRRNMLPSSLGWLSLAEVDAGVVGDSRVQGILANRAEKGEE